MFSNPIDQTLHQLAHAYTCYCHAEWDYARSDAGVGGFSIDRCIEDALYLSYFLGIIAQGIEDGKENAKKACLLFDKLYKDGFKNGLYKDCLQEHFKKILSPENIEKLNSGASMNDCLKPLREVIKNTKY